MGNLCILQGHLPVKEYALSLHIRLDIRLPAYQRYSFEEV